MKKATIIIILIIYSMCYLNAQINLEHTFNINSNYMFVFKTHSQTMYYYIDSDIVYFYNENYTFYKSTNIPIPNGYNSSGIYYPSTQLFNNDNLIEFFCVFSKNDFLKVKSIIYNENSSIIKEFDNSSLFFIYETKNSNTKMMMHRYTNYPDNYVVEIYSLPGDINATVGTEYTQDIGAPYPNPTDDEIYLPYKLDNGETFELHIFDSNGRLIESLQIGSHFDKILLNTASYLPGLYIYKYKNVSNSFIVK